MVYQIMGVASHAGDPDAERFENDMGFEEFFKTIKVLDDKWPTLKVSADSSVDPLDVHLRRHRPTARPSSELYKLGGQPDRASPRASPAASADEFRRAIHDHVVPQVDPARGAADRAAPATSTKQMTLEIHLLFGTESGWSVRSYFKEAFKNGDVVLYDGHSYIGSGPLDPEQLQRLRLRRPLPDLLLQLLRLVQLLRRRLLRHQGGRQQEASIW